jgi:LysM repeat protein
MKRLLSHSALLAALVVVLPDSDAHAQEGAFVYVVKSGETLASIAQRFYGDALYEKVLVTENGLTGHGGVSIIAGMKLVVPYSSYYRVKSGDSWSKLAEQFYGSADRAHVIPQANNLSKDAVPEDNAQLLVPYAVRHVADQRDDLSNICEAYYGSLENLAALRRFNRLSRNKLKRTQVILIPMPKLVLSEQGRRIIEAHSGMKLADGSIRALQAQSDQRLAQLREQVRRGRYLEAVAHGYELLGLGALTANQSVVVHSELATAFVALERDDLALKAFVAALALRPDLELDTAKTSPKVLTLLRKAQKTRR